MRKVKERPIILSVNEVRAVLAGEKTQHRTPLLTKKEASEGFEWDFSADGDSAICIKETDGEHQETLRKPCPFGAIGDRLWVRETHHVPDFLDDYEQDELARGLITRDSLGMSYKADAPHMTPADGGWSSPVAMPRWASRILLEITDIRIERLQDINADDAINEGCPLYGPFGEYRGSNRNRPNDPMKYKAYGTPKDAFACIWISKHGRESWVSNPWVWVLEFKKVEV